MNALKDLLQNRECFKLVCGAGNEDVNEVEKLVYIYSKAGCNMFDLSANLDVVIAAKRGLKRAGIFENRFLCVSTGIKGDPHTYKAYIDSNKCSSCKKCVSVCPQSAINLPDVINYRCIGCCKCEKVCPENAFKIKSEVKNPEEVLPSIIKEGVDCLEFHALIENEQEVFDKWSAICKLYDGMLSICIDRSLLGNKSVLDRISKMITNRKPYTTIIQADGAPMSGGCDDYKTTLQAVAMAEIIMNENLPVFILLSGGTNSKTSELSKLCGITASGVAIGTYARQIIKKYIEQPDFYENSYLIEQAVYVAKNLVDVTLKNLK